MFSTTYYWGKPALRDDREDDGNGGIIRSPIRAIVPPDPKIWSHSYLFSCTESCTSGSDRAFGSRPNAFAIHGLPRKAHNPDVGSWVYWSGREPMMRILRVSWRFAASQYSSVFRSRWSRSSSSSSWSACARRNDDRSRRGIVNSQWYGRILRPSFTRISGQPWGRRASRAERECSRRARPPRQG